MRRLSLGTLLTGMNVGLVAAAVVCVAVAAGGLLQRFTDEQELARVSLAGSIGAFLFRRALEIERAAFRAEREAARKAGPI